MAQSKLVVVTGGAGFVGSRLCGRLRKEGYTVLSLDNYFAGSKDAQVPGVEYREGHTKDIEKHVPETPDIIYHLGEYARVEQSVLEPEVVYDLNVLGTKGVVDFWVKKRCKLVYAGSSTKFGDGGLARSTSPYASSKAANSELVKEVGEREKLPYAITYFYNVFGPGERAGLYGTLIEAFKRMYLSGSPITVVSPGTQVRNFTHVDDIVDGLIVVGEKGQGDEFGLGNEHSSSVLEVAKLFGGDILMLPERASNRMRSELDTSKSAALGWKASRSLESYIKGFLAENPRGQRRERRVLVFSTTFYPVAGPAEEALVSLMRTMPEVHFDIITTRFSKNGRRAESPLPNAHVCRVGFGNHFDKYLLPMLAYRKARALHRQHRYLFAWSIMASYAALAALLLKRRTSLPLLITLADQKMEHSSVFSRFMLMHILANADQVYGIHAEQESRASTLAAGRALRRSIGDGDAFANQLRYVYADILRTAKPRA